MAFLDQSVDKYLQKKKQIVSQFLTFALANYLFSFISLMTKIVEIEMNFAVTYAEVIMLSVAFLYCYAKCNRAPSLTRWHYQSQV